MPRSAEEDRLLQRATRVGSTVRFRLPADAKRRSIVGEVVDEVALIRDRHKLVLQQIRYPQHHLWDDDEIAYRLGYFRIAHHFGAPTRIEWSYHSILVTSSELSFLLRQAAQRGWKLPQAFG